MGEARGCLEKDRGWGKGAEEEPLQFCFFFYNLLTTSSLLVLSIFKASGPTRPPSKFLVSSLDWPTLEDVAVAASGKVISSHPDDVLVLVGGPFYGALL